MKRILFFAVVFMICTGCKRQAVLHPPNPTNTALPVADPTSNAPLKRTVNGLTATLAVSPSPPVLMQAASLRLTLRDARGKPISGRKVRLDLTMPAMAMPPNQPEATAVGNGVFTAKALFTMAGEWQIRADVSGSQKPFIFRLKTR